MKALDFSSFETLAIQNNIWIIDTRHHALFLKNHLPNAIFLGVDGPFEIWTKILLSNTSKQLLLITPPNRHKEVLIKLNSYGVTNILGYLSDDLEVWIKKTTSIASITALEFKNKLQNNPLVFDVRKSNEYEDAHLKSALHTPLNFIDKYINQFPNKTPYYLFCGGGYRSVIAASILKAKGFVNPINIEGGFKAIAATGINVNVRNF